MSTPINLYKIFEVELTQRNNTSGEVALLRHLPLDSPLEWFVLRFESMTINSRTPRFRKASANGMRASQMCLPLKPIPIELANGGFFWGEYSFANKEEFMAHIASMIPKPGETIYFQDLTCDTSGLEKTKYLDGNRSDSFSSGAWLTEAQNMGPDEAKQAFKIKRSRLMKYSDQTTDDFVAQGFLDLQIESTIISAEERAGRYWNDLVSGCAKLNIPQHDPYVYLLDVVRVK